MALLREINKAASVPFRLLVRALPSQKVRGKVSRGMKKGARYFLVACMPKSGSTLLTNIIGSLPGFEVGSMVPEYGRREQELDELSLINSTLIFKRTVFQHHVRCSEWTRSLIESYPFHVIVLCRRLPDIIVSISDHFDNESIASPMAHVSSGQLEKLDEEGLRYHFIVDVIIPWYVNFYASWVRYKREGGKVQFVYYEDLIADKSSVIASVIRQAGVFQKGIDNELQDIMQRGVFSRMNKGVIGRGAILSDHPGIQEKIDRLVSYYPDVDFDLIV